MARGGRLNQDVAFIFGAGHSGTTLLGLLLGAHPRVCFAGEAWNSTRLGSRNTQGRVLGCNLCTADCPVWSDSHADGSPDVYEMLARRTGRRFAVDSTKAVAWVDQQESALPSAVRRHLIVLLRDGRAVVNSGLRKYPDATPEALTTEWVAHMRRTEDLATRWPGTVTRLHYEDLAEDTENTLRSLAAPLGLEFLTTMLDPWHSEQHPLGGNQGTQFLVARARATRAPAGPDLPPPPDTAGLGPSKRGYYRDHPPAVVLDTRWRDEMSPAALAVFEAIGGDTNLPYAR
ncbi:hypothetical protein GCM10010361_29470 [Streptomyces olivaceiscleroticus]|uniref:Sulfotransferase n=1 Tax=Streptomyces olivaceiscleroticus TaxID=68245 RepID=A0ABN0ZZ95_9ACTN